MRLLVIDCETGGLDASKHSILTVAGYLWINTRPVSISPVFNLTIDEGPDLVADPEALEVNGIDLDDVRAEGVSPAEGVKRIREALAGLFPGEGPVRLAGQNVAFDVSFLRRLWRLAGETDLEDVFGHRALDTSSVVTFLQAVGVVPMFAGDGEPVKANFRTLRAIAGVDLRGEDEHTASGDAFATACALGVVVDRVRETIERGTPPEVFPDASTQLALPLDEGAAEDLDA